MKSDLITRVFSYAGLAAIVAAYFVFDAETLWQSRAHPPGPLYLPIGKALCFIALGILWWATRNAKDKELN